VPVSNLKLKAYNWQVFLGAPRLCPPATPITGWRCDWHQRLLQSKRKITFTVPLRGLTMGPNEEHNNHLRVFLWKHFAPPLKRAAPTTQVGQMGFLFFCYLSIYGRGGSIPLVAQRGVLCTCPHDTAAMDNVLTINIVKVMVAAVRRQHDPYMHFYILCIFSYDFTCVINFLICGLVLLLFWVSTCGEDSLGEGHQLLTSESRHGGPITYYIVTRQFLQWYNCWCYWCLWGCY